MHALLTEREGAGQTLHSSEYIEGHSEFDVRVWVNNATLSNSQSRLLRNVVHVYMAENAYVIVRADKNVFTFCMDTCRLEIN